MISCALTWYFSPNCDFYLSEYDIIDCDLTYGDLGDRDLSDCDLTEFNLSNCYLSDCDLSDVD